MTRAWALAGYGFFGVLVVCAATGSAQQRVLLAEERVGAFAQAALGNYVRDVITPGNYGKFGFRSLADARAARVGTPLRVYMIGLRDLKAYRAGEGARAILQDAGTLWFPVTAGGTVVTKLEVVEKENRLIAGEFGGLKSAQTMEAMRTTLPGLLQERGVPLVAPATPVIVRVPSLGITLLYVDTPWGEFAVATEANPERLGIDGGRAYPIAEVLRALALAAQQVDEKKIR